MAVFTHSLSVRYNECDAYEHVNHAHYANFINEAALRASASIGLTPQALAKKGVVWLAREHDIEFLHPLHFGETVTVETWVTDFRPVRSQRAYRLHNGRGLAARAVTDWVYIDRTTGEPRPIPSGMRQAYREVNGGPPLAGFERSPFPQAAPLPTHPYRFRQDVEWRDVDPQQHVNNAAYFSYLENATWALMGEKGWPLARLRARRFGIVARRYRLVYLEPLVMGDRLEVMTWVSDARRATAVRHYTIHRVEDRVPVVKARALWVWVDLATGRPIRIPADFREDFTDNFTRDGEE